MVTETFNIPVEWKVRAEEEKALAKRLGDNIGYGRMMQLAQECWREVLEEQGFEGGEFAYGPCVAMTVPCECSHPCEWCNGAGWLTPHVKQIKDSAKKTK